MSQTSLGSMTSTCCAAWFCLTVVCCVAWNPVGRQWTACSMTSCATATPCSRYALQRTSYLKALPEQASLPDLHT